MMKTLISILVIFFSSYLFAEVKIYEDLPDGDFNEQGGGTRYCTNTGKDYVGGCGGARHKMKVIKENNYYLLKSDKNYCLRIGGGISVKKCKSTSDDLKLAVEIIGQHGGGKRVDNSYFPGSIKFVLKNNKNKYLGLGTKTSDIHKAKVFTFESKELDICGKNDLDNEENIYCSCTGATFSGYYKYLIKSEFHHNYIHLSNKVINDSIYKDFSKKKSIKNSKFILSFCRTALIFFKQNNSFKYVLDPKNKKFRQQYQNVYFIDGEIYISEVKNFLKTKKIFDNKSDLYIQKNNTILDIDEFQDLMYYKFLINKSVLK